MLECKLHGVEAIMRRTAAAEHVCIKTEKLRTGYSQSKPSLVSEQLASENVCGRHFEYLVGISM